MHGSAWAQSSGVERSPRILKALGSTLSVGEKQRPALFYLTPQISPVRKKRGQEKRVSDWPRRRKEMTVFVCLSASG